MSRTAWAILCVVAGLTLAASRGPYLRAARPGNPAADPLLARREAPLLAVGAVALGGFRGLLADILWLRASYLQDEQRYVELVALSSLITRLEPGIEEVWTYHAWNLAYNVSVVYPRAAERWRWVRHGLRLLYEDGMRLHPDGVRIPTELAWIHLHKIAGDTDRHHRHYRQALAQEIDATLGASPAAQAEALRALQRTRAAPPFGLRAERALQLMARVGELDWRAPESHALYWAAVALQARSTANRDWAARLFAQSLLHGMRQGGVFLDPAHPDTLTQLPNLALRATAEQALAQIEAHGNRGGAARARIELARALLLAGQPEEAATAYAAARAHAPDVLTQETLAAGLYERDLGPATERTAALEALVTDALLRALFWACAGQDAPAAGHRAYAQGLYAEHLRRPSADPGTTPASWEDLAARAAHEALATFPAHYRDSIPDRVAWLGER